MPCQCIQVPYIRVGEREKIDNNGVYVKGDVADGVLKEILEFECIGEPVKRVVLFYCEWYDPKRLNRTCKHNNYKIIEINHTKRYATYDPFIIAQNARQVYYLSYSGKCKLNWKVIIKIKSSGRVKAEKVFEKAYQDSKPVPLRIVVNIEISSSLHSTSGEVEIVEPSTQRLVRIIDGTKLDGGIEDRDDEFNDDVDSKSDEDNPQLPD